MNKIFKVIYSKVRNCYVVTSEFAKANTKSSTGSEKSKTGKKALLTLGAACAIFCGGLVNVGASVQSETISAGGTTSNPVLTVDNTDDAAQLNKVISAAKEDKLLTKDNLSGQLTDYAKTNDVTEVKDAAKTLSDKIDNADTGLNSKASTSLDNLTETGSNKIKELAKASVSSDLAGKTNQDMDNLSETGSNKIKELAKSAVDLTDFAKTEAVNESLENKADKSLGNIDADGEAKIKNVMKDSLDAKANASDVTAVAERVTTIETTIGDGTTNGLKKDINDLKDTVGDTTKGLVKGVADNKAAIGELDKKTTQISYDNGSNSTQINGMDVGANQVDMASKNLTNVGTINGTTIGEKVTNGTYVKQDKSLWGNLGELDTQTKTNTEKIDELDKNSVKYDSDTKDKISLKGTDGTTITNLKDATLSDTSKDAVTGKQLNATNTKLTEEATTRENEDTKLSNRIGTVANNGKYIQASNDTNTIAKNLEYLDTALASTDQRTSKITRDDTKNETAIEGKVRIDNNGNVKAEGTINSTGVDAGNGEIKTTGKVSAGDVSTGTLETTGKATIGGDLEVKGNLNVREISMKNDKHDAASGDIHDSSTSITADGISNKASIENNGKTKESQFNHNEKGTFNYAKDGNSSDWKETNSNVTANGVENIAKDSKGNNNTFIQTSTETKNTLTDGAGNTSSTRQDAKGNYGYAKDKDGNKSYTKQEGNRLAESVIGKDGKETKSEMTTTDITNTAKSGTIKNDAKDIENKATNEITNEAGQKITDKVGSNTRITDISSIKDSVGSDTSREMTSGKITDTAGDSSVTTENGKGTTFTKTGSTAFSDGGVTDTNISGNKLTTGRVESNELKVSDKDGNNTADLDVKAGEGVTASASNGTTTGSLGVKADEVGSSVKDATGGTNGSSFRQRIDAIMGNVKSADGESEVIQNGNQITSEVGKGESTSSKVTQTKDMLQTALTDGTNYNVSQDATNASAKLLTDGTKTNKTQDNLDSSERKLTNGTYETSSLQTALDITNTAKDGTIKNDAKDIENIASGNIKNSSATMDTTVTGEAKESYGKLTTTIENDESHTVKGNQSTTVEGDVTEDYKKNLTTTVGGDELHEVTGTKTETVTGKVTENFNGGQETNVTGDQITIVSGTQTTTATDIKRNASSSMVDNISNDYGTNTETKVAGKTTTDMTITGTGEKGQYIRGANESRDYLIKGTLKNSETKTAETTSTEITDGSGNTSSTIQDKGQISGSVTNGTDKAVSNVKADSIDSAVTGAGSSSVINQKKDSITSSVGNGTTSTVIQQGEKDITIASNGGTVAIAGKDIINNASGNMTNIVGGDLTTTVTGKTTEDYKGGLDTTVTGEENHKVTGKQTNTIEGGQENIISGGQTNTITGDQNTTVTGDISNKAKNIVNTADESITNNAKVINNKASEVINNEAVNINNKASGIISSSASEIKNKADKLISSKVGENTYQNIEDGKITESIKNGTKQNLTQSDAEKTEHSVVDGTNSSVTRQTSTTIEEAVTDGTNANASLKNASMSAETITNGTQANTVASTANGTTFTNSDASTALTEGGATNTTIKGNTITTGKVTMDYADVMKDLGVRGNATIEGKTKTGSLEVINESTFNGKATFNNGLEVTNGDTKLKNTEIDGTLNVTQNATIGGTLDVTGKASFKDSVDVAKDLTVGGNATITGDVTANSYKVGNNTYIDGNGINANGQVIRNVGAGEISETSTDAVNGSQLFATNRRIEQFDSRINEVGANAAAIANLHPMEFDADSKMNVAVGVGNYRNKTATAMGVFYRPNEDVMFNVSSTIGSNDNMVGGGVSFRLGSGGNKQKNKALAEAAEQNKQLKSQVDTLQAQMDALLSVINPNMSKDFPDVPDNHWAYEAVTRLAGNDIIQGYEDGKYHGERTMTRYEMAAIIYKALQKGAKAEAKLVEEFKPELKALAAHEKA